MFSQTESKAVGWDARVLQWPTIPEVGIASRHQLIEWYRFLDYRNFYGKKVDLRTIVELIIDRLKCSYVEKK